MKSSTTHFPIQGSMNAESFFSSGCEFTGTLDAILKMIRYEGLYGFYKGMSTKIVQSVLAAAVLFMIKEELVKGAKLLLSNATSSRVKSKPS